MKWKDSDEKGQPDNEPVEDYVDEETYSPWQKKTPGSWFSMGAGKPILLFILAAAGLLILVFVVGNIFSNTGGGSYDGEFRVLDERIRQLELKLDTLEETYATVSQINGLNNKNEQLKGRFDRMESALSLRMDLITKKVSKSKANTAAVAKKKTAQKAPEKKSVGKTTPKPVEKTPVRYHDVSAKETLFSISRKYDLTVGELMKMNNLAKDQTIQVGQKLIVGP